MKPGIELNERIAREVMGYEKSESGVWRQDKIGECVVIGKDIPDFSGSILYAWKVVEKIRETWPKIAILSDGNDWLVCSSREIGASDDGASATSAPLAICLAALRAVNPKQDE